MFNRTLARLSFAIAATSTLLALPALADSQARIVRLSDVQGSVQMDKNSGLGFENAFLNMPVTQGTQLRTGNNGRAEVEFEDGSTLRLAPDTLVEFNTLGLSDAGKRTSQVNLVEGMAYVNWLGKDDFTLSFAREVAALDRGAHFRADVSADVANLAVFKGEVPLEGPSGKLVVEKKKTVTFNAADDAHYKLADKIVEAPLDSWDKESISYHDQYAKNNNSSPYGYGLSDLNYYGAYSNVPGYGMMWQPYFTGVGWDPFMDGAWGWYPGFGYMYASAYPWGWLPYRYGNWMFVPGFGWMWQPGGWNTWMAVPRYTPTTLVHVNPLVAPAAGSVKTVVVGRAATMSSMHSRYTVSAGSAGLGIARGSFTNLGHLNHQVAKTGFAEVRSAPQFAASAPSARPSGFSEPHSSMLAPSMRHASSVGHASSGGTSKH